MSFVAVLAAGLAAALALNHAFPDGLEKRLDADIAASTGEIVVLGNSVALSAIDPDALSAALGLPGRAVTVLALEGAGPPVWLATYAHARERAPAPRVVVVYVPVNMLWLPDPPADAELALLAALDAPPAAWALARTDRSALRIRLDELRFRGRDAFLGGLSGWAADLAWPATEGTQRAASTRARAALFESHTPNAAAAQAPRLEGASAAARPEATRPDVIDALIATTRADGARLVVVQPAQSPADLKRPCGPVVLLPDMEAYLDRAGVDLLDLATSVSEMPLFRTHHHLTHEGASRLTATLAAGLRAIDAAASPVDTPARRWVAPCDGGQGRR